MEKIKKSAVGVGAPATESIERSTDKSIADIKRKSKGQVYKSRVYTERPGYAQTWILPLNSRQFRALSLPD